MGAHFALQLEMIMTTHHMRITERLNAPTTQRLRTVDSRILTVDDDMVPAGSFGCLWTGTAGDGSGRVPQQVDLDHVARSINAGLSLLSPAEQAQVRALLTKFSGRQAAPVGPTGQATNDAAESARRVAAEMKRNGDIAKGYNDFWDRQNAKMAADIG